MRSRVWLLAFWFCAVAAAWAQPTWSKDVSRIFQAKCQQCHRPGDIAPFALLNYDDAVTYAADIRESVDKNRMPPWKPVPGFGEFRDAFGLSADEKQAILDWIDAGTPLGDPAELPDPLPLSNTQWELGDPDLVLAMPEYTPPRAKDTYRCFVLPTGLDENRFVSAGQVVPGDKQQVHHVLLFVDQSGQADKLDGQDGQPGYTCFGGPGVQLTIGGLLGGWAPGARTHYLPDGIGLLLPGKARIVMQVHYHPNGRIAPDRTQVGLWFRSAEDVRKRLINVPILNTSFVIPAGARDYEVRASLPILPFLAGQAITVAPHMHLLGQTIKMEVEDPDGQKRPLIFIHQWNFNWQGFYTFIDPVVLPAGSTIRLTSTYDNSENNPLNPNNPLKAVRWGEGTEDEMCIGFVGMIFDNENLLPLRAGGR